MYFYGSILEILENNLVWF